MPIKFANNATATLASGIASDATSLTVAAGKGALFPNVKAGSTDYFFLTLASGATVEVVKVTERTADTFTITRAQEGTSAAAFAAGATVELRITAQGLRDATGSYIQSSDAIVGTARMPLEDIGPEYNVDGGRMARIKIPGCSATRYALDGATTFTAQRSANLEVAATSDTHIGTIRIPAGAFLGGDSIDFALQVTTRQMFSSGGAGNAALVLKIGEGGEADYTVYSGNSQEITLSGTLTVRENGNAGIALSNLLGNGSTNGVAYGSGTDKDVGLMNPLDLKIYVRWTEAQPAGHRIRLGRCSATVTPAVGARPDWTVSYRDPAITFPFPADDVFNTPLGAGAVLRTVQTTTVSGTSGESTVTVGSAANITLGSFVSGTGIAANAIVQAISGTTVTLDKTNTGAVSGTGTFTPVETFTVRDKATATGYVMPSTGLTVGYNNYGLPWSDSGYSGPHFVTDTDVFATWNFSSRHYNGAWPFALTGTNTFQMRTPNNIVAGTGGGDSNVVIITPDRRFSIEIIGYSFNAGTGVHSCAHISVVDLYAYSNPHILHRSWDMDPNAGWSISTRGGGFTMIGGLVTKYDLDRATNSTTAQTAIQHALALVIDTAHLTSHSYMNGATETNLKAWASDQWFFHRPQVASAGSGYAVGDVLYLEGGTFITPMRMVVSQVTSAGGVVKVLVKHCGQYKTIPSGTFTAMTTRTSGSGSGCTINLTPTNNPLAIDTFAEAFPDLAKAGVRTWPATNADGGWYSNYKGTIPMGAMFAIPQSVNVTTLGLTSNEALAVAYALQKYGGYVVDVSFQADNMYIPAGDISTAQFDALTGYNGNGQYDYVNVRLLKAQLCYVENSSYATPGGPGTRLGNFPAPLYPLY